MQRTVREQRIACMQVSVRRREPWPLWIPSPLHNVEAKKRGQQETDPAPGGQGRPAFHVRHYTEEETQ